MPDLTANNPAAISPSPNRGRPYATRILRVIIVLLLVVAIVSAVVWWPRRAVWAVLAAGGMISTFDAALSKDVRKSTPSDTERMSPSNSPSSSVTSDWLALDRMVTAVNLTRTRVGPNRLSNLAPMLALESLALDRKQLGNEIAVLAELRHLREVQVDHPLTETQLDVLLTLPLIERIQLIEPTGNLAGLEKLADHPLLRRLDLVAIDPGSRDWSGLLEQCSTWPHLEAISIRTAHSLMPGLRTLTNCESLKSLEISAPVDRSTMLVIASLINLTHLSLNVRNLADDDWLLLADLKNLRSLQIYGGGGIEPPYAELKRRLPDCHVQGAN